MRICFLTKYPPIQGGVSMHCYWAARGLAERGHQVVVVTNADEVEDTFRIRIPEADLAEGGHYQPRFPETGGSVTVLSTRPPDRRELYYIPLGNPTVSRLAGIATGVIRDHDCQVVFSYYLEPYGLAAFLAGRFTGVPYVFKHAGSDLHRLMRLPELRTTYTEVLRGANRVISRGPSRARLLEAGVPEEVLTAQAGFGLPTAFFNPTGASRSLGQWLATGGSPGPYPDDDLPVLGMYGKLGEYKGSLDVLHAMARLRDEGFRFRLLAASHGWQEQAFRRLAEELGLSDHVHLIPFVPHWHIPAFIRSCTAVAFLEREFPIAAHTPTIPTEVIACGGPLVVSAEVAAKQLFRTSIRDRRNVIVTNPRRHEDLAASLRYALEDSARARAIGLRGHAELRYEQSYDSYIGELEGLLTEVAAEPPTYGSRPRTTADAPSDAERVLRAVGRFYPRTRALLTADDEQRLRRRTVPGLPATGHDNETRRGTALRVGRLLLDLLPEPASVSRDVCRYEYKIHQWARDAGPARKPVEAPGADGGWRAHPERARPVFVGEGEIVEFAHDVEPVIEALAQGRPGAPGEGPLRVLFHEAAAPLRVSEPTAWVIRLLRAGGRPTVAQIEEAVRKRYPAAFRDPGRAASRQCRDLLEGLFWEGLVTFD
ncbi:glycosyltransferase family 4 protein [Streptomyces sp. NPDC047049]|uniref:glycosyltransferase family 4 protein n=1 Tax=Streptomyces sp. NPDC047049 TaxID=3156688 RepID=UPI0033F240C6